MEHKWWFASVALAAIQIVRIEALFGVAQEKGNATVYRGSLLLRAMLGGVAAFIIVFIWLKWSETELWLSLSALTFAIWFLFAWPPTIVIDRDAVYSFRWWKKSQVIPWNQVEDVETNNEGDIQVIGTEQTIEFSRFQTDSSSFRQQLLVHSKVERINTKENSVRLKL
jgi:hypothetical protein